MFYKEVNIKKRGEMIAFLKNHFRYYYVEFRIMPSVTKLMLFKRWIS